MLVWGRFRTGNPLLFQPKEEGCGFIRKDSNMSLLLLLLLTGEDFHRKKNPKNLFLTQFSLPLRVQFVFCNARRCQAVDHLQQEQSAAEQRVPPPGRAEWKHQQRNKYREDGETPDCHVWINKLRGREETKGLAEGLAACVCTCVNELLTEWWDALCNGCWTGLASCVE